jgi:hypothetical protein
MLYLFLQEIGKLYYINSILLVNLENLTILRDISSYLDKYIYGLVFFKRQFLFYNIMHISISHSVMKVVKTKRLLGILGYDCEFFQVLSCYDLFAVNLFMCGRFFFLT